MFTMINDDDDDDDDDDDHHHFLKFIPVSQPAFQVTLARWNMTWKLARETWKQPAGP